ncbi:MAG: hypothetical protein U1F42_10145 [Candidatus Competibacteraceae bacterium]
MAASGQINPVRLSQYEFFGELALAAHCAACAVFCLPLSPVAKRAHLLVPDHNAGEALLVSGVTVLGATHLLEVCQQLNTGTALQSPASTQRQPSLEHALERI